jgi:hypothetical protein
MTTDLSQFTEAELNEISQRSIWDIIDGKVPVTPATPVMVIDAATDRPAIVTVRQLGESMLREAHGPGYLGTAAGAVVSLQGLDLLAAAGITPQTRKASR